MKPDARINATALDAKIRIKIQLKEMTNLQMFPDNFF